MYNIDINPFFDSLHWGSPDMCGNSSASSFPCLCASQKNANLYDAVTFDRKGVRRSHLLIFKALEVYFPYQKKIC